jgi:ketosteroid isomerase-like protein
VSEDRREEVIRQAFADFQARDLAGVAGFLHPDIECRVAPPLMNAGEWRGPAGFMAMTASWEEAFGEIAYEILGIELVDDRNALVPVHQEGTGAESGVPVGLDVYFLIEFEGEQAIRFQIHPDRDAAVEAV